MREFDLEERTSLMAFGFVIDPDGATATLPPREVTIETTGGMELIIMHPNGDSLFMGCHTLVGTVAGVEHRGEIVAADEMAAERAAGLVQLGFIAIDDVNGFRWPEGTVAVAVQITKKGSCSFDVVMTFTNGDQLFVACDFLCGRIGGVEWADSEQRTGASSLLAHCA